MNELPSYDGYPPGVRPSDIGGEGDLQCECCKETVVDHLNVCPWCNMAVCLRCWDIDNNECKKCSGE